MFQNLQIKGLASIKLTCRLIGVIRCHLDAYSEHSETSKMENFCKKLHLRCFAGFVI